LKAAIPSVRLSVFNLFPSDACLLGAQTERPLLPVNFATNYTHTHNINTSTDRLYQRVDKVSYTDSSYLFIMKFQPSVTLLLITAKGASAFAPQIAPSRTSHSHAISAEESTTALFKKRSVTKSKDKPQGKGFGAALRDLRNNSFPYAGSIRPGTQSPQKIVIDESIMKPDYALDTIVSTA